MCGRWRGAWARAGWRVWDLGNGTIMLQKLFNPEWQITSKFFLLSSFLIGFSFSPTAEISRFWRKFAAENRVNFQRRDWTGVKWSSQSKKQIFSVCQISPSASSTRDLGMSLQKDLRISNHSRHRFSPSLKLNASFIQNSNWMTSSVDRHCTFTEHTFSTPAISKATSMLFSSQGCSDDKNCIFPAFCSIDL